MPLPDSVGGVTFVRSLRYVDCLLEDLKADDD